MAGRGRNYAWMLTMSLLVLGFEALLGLVAVMVWGATLEKADVGPNGLGLVGLAVFLPVAALVGALAAAVLSHVVVLPAVWLGDALARLFRRRPAWWWVLLAAVAVPLPVVALVEWRNGHGLGPGTLARWALVAAVAVPPALLCRLRGPGRGWAPIGVVALWGVGAVVGAGLLGGVALATGVLESYEPPRVSREVLTGTWSDGEEVVLVLRPDGTATATGVAQFDFEERVAPCSGEGTWSFDPGAGTWEQSIEIVVPGCAQDDWQLMGTSERPTLYSYIGDPDSVDLYELTRLDD
jgi:hypothetical protein